MMLLLFTLICGYEDAPKPQKPKIVEKYDAKLGRLTITMDSLPITGSRFSGLAVRGEVVFKGKDRAEVETILLFLHSTSGNYRYRRQHKVELSADSVLIDVGTPEYKGDTLESVGVVESLVVSLDPAALRTLAYAKRIKLTIGSLEVELPKHVRAGLFFLANDLP